MKDRRVIILVASFAVLICLVLSLLLFITVTPSLLVIFSFAAGVVTGICIASMIQYFKNLIRNARLDDEK
jgi:hypothetical protein